MMPGTNQWEPGAEQETAGDPQTLEQWWAAALRWRRRVLEPGVKPGKCTCSRPSEDSKSLLGSPGRDEA